MYAIIESYGRQYKAKKNYRRTQGHRQPYTKVEITKIKTATEKK